MFETCFLHIGTEKTGTKSIQAFMTVNYERLKVRGLLYPRSLGPHNHRKLRNFAANTHTHVMGAEVRDHPQGVEGFRRQLTAEFLDEIAGCACRTLIISDEHFHSSLTTPEEIDRLRAFVQPHCQNIQVLLYLRRQDQLCLSYYSEYIKSGHSDDAPLREKGIKYYYDYKSLIQNYQAVFGDSNITVRIFEQSRLKNGNVVDDFNAAIGLLDVAGLQQVSRRNVSLSPAALKFLAAFNRHIPHAIADKLNPERSQVRTWLEQYFQGNGWPVSRQWAVDFFQRYRAINEWVRERFFAEQTSLFDEDFADYPVAEAATDLGFDDAVAIACVLWRCQANALIAAESTVTELRKQLARRDSVSHPAPGKTP